MTSRILEALYSVPLKITGRLKDKKDLSSVTSALSSLAGYLYSAIPEISGTERHSSAEMEEFGERSLSRFVEAIEPLTLYIAEPQPLRGKERAKFKIAAVIAWIASLFCHENLLLKFSVWWILTQTLVIAAVFSASRYVPGLKLDSTLISLIVGTPLLVSAAALAGPLRRK
jgi:hypothetical protein